MQKSYYAIIPANVRYDKDLPPNAKLLYGELTALSNQKGYCWASNAYFAELYGVQKRSITNWIAKLKEKGYITVHVENKENGFDRKISIVKTEEEDDEKEDPQENKDKGGGKKVPDPQENNFLSQGKKVLHNTTYNNKLNNTTNSIMSHIEKYNDSVLKLTEYFYEKIINEVRPPTYKNRKPKIENWIDSIDKLIRIDKIEKKKIKDVIDFAVNDEFWKGVILSTAKLRKHFNQLFLQMTKKPKNRDGPQTFRQKENRQSIDSMPEEMQKAFVKRNKIDKKHLELFGFPEQLSEDEVLKIDHEKS